MKIVFLDVKSIGDDWDIEEFRKLGEVVLYPYSREEEIPRRVSDADIVIVNKVQMNEKTLAGADKLKLVCVTATGTNNLDKEYLAKKNIAWRNVAGYSTENVAQHTFALLFYLLEKLHYYDTYVKTEKYVNDEMFTHFAEPIHELCALTWGIIGMGAIGQRVASLAEAFGCSVIYYSTSGKNLSQKYTHVSLEELLRRSDIVSVHAPLTKQTEHLMDEEAFKQMKASAIFINVGRGSIVDEQALANALERGEIAAAGLDVLDTEPMREDNPLRRIKDSRRLIITPHIAWASVEARKRLMKIVAGQIREFQQKM